MNIPIESNLVDTNNKLVMFWTPKAGCTRAICMMFKHLGLLDDAKKYGIHKYRSDIFYEKYGTANMSHLTKEYTIFKSQRNYIHVKKSKVKYGSSKKVSKSENVKYTIRTIKLKKQETSHKKYFDIIKIINNEFD